MEKAKKKTVHREYFFMLAITFLIGLFLSYGSIGLPIKMKISILLVSYLPFILFSIITLLTNEFKNNKKAISIIKFISIIITCLLFFYYLIAIFFISVEEATNPVTNPKYYNIYIYLVQD